MAVTCAAITVAAAAPAAAAGSFVVDDTVNTVGAVSIYPTTAGCLDSDGVFRSPQAQLTATAPATQAVTSGDLISLTFRFDPPLVVSRNIFFFSIGTRLQPPGGGYSGGPNFAPVTMTLTGSNLASGTGLYGTAYSYPTGVSVLTGMSTSIVDASRDGLLSAVHAEYTLPAGLTGTVEAQVSLGTGGPCGDPLLYPQPPCAAGTYRSGDVCVPADPGFFVGAAGATAQSPCPAGSYQPNAGALSCIPASPGYYVAGLASIAQSACAVGTFQASSGGATCNGAPPGYYVDHDAASAATPCAAGTYQPFAMAASCVVAEPGFYVPMAGSAVHYPCPSGTTSLAAATACVPIDGAAPSITITTPADGAQHLLGATVHAAYACTDEPGGSGVASCTGPVANGAAIDTSTIGAKTFRVNAADHAGNASNKTSTYRVVYGFSGFGAPVDPAPTLNSAKAGRTIPLKFVVTAADGTGITTLTSVKVTVTSLACATGATVDELEEYASGASGLQNLGNGAYQFNWSTPTAYAQSCKTLSLDLGDGVARTALFRFTK